MTVYEGIAKAVKQLDRDDLELLCAASLILATAQEKMPFESAERAANLCDKVLEEAERLQLESN